jgi:hypothetical protein
MNLMTGTLTICVLQANIFVASILVAQQILG